MAELPRRIIKVRCAPPRGSTQQSLPPGDRDRPAQPCLPTSAKRSANAALNRCLTLQETKRLLQEPGVRVVPTLLAVTGDGGLAPCVGGASCAAAAQEL